MSLRDFFKGSDSLRIEELAEQKAIRGNVDLANAIDQIGELVAIDAGEAFIAQGDDTKDVYFILAGSCEIQINGRVVAKRGSRDHVGEMAVLQPTQRRSASCIAVERIVAVKLTSDEFRQIDDQFPIIYRPLARELSNRLLERNSSLPGFREKIRLFIICSAESLPVARQIQNGLEHDPINVIIWTDGVFKVSSYPIEALEAELDNSDFAVAIAHDDDRTLSRGTDWPAPRDNVIFELGMFLGRLGRSRAILMEPREAKVKLPSDLSGITTIAYSFPEDGEDIAASMGPACNRLREHILSLGPFNG